MNALFHLRCLALCAARRRRGKSQHAFTTKDVHEHDDEVRLPDKGAAISDPVPRAAESCDVGPTLYKQLNIS